MFIQQDCILAYELTQVKIVFCVWKAAGTYEARTSLESFSASDLHGFNLRWRLFPGRILRWRLLISASSGRNHVNQLT